MNKFFRFLLLFCIVASIFGCSSSKKENTNNSSNSEIKESELVADVDEYTDVYVGMIMRFPDDWMSKKVRVYVDNPTNNNVAIEKAATNEYEMNFSAELGWDGMDDYKFKDFSLMIIEGKVAFNGNDIGLDNPAVVDTFVSADKASEKMSGLYSEYIDASEKQNEIEAEKKAIAMAEFKESAEWVSWDDLRRYPDSYKGKAVVLTLTLKVYEPDGLILEGDKIGVIPGTDNEVVLSDDRDIKEPRYAKGDKITFYGVADGVTVVKIKDGSSIFSNTIDEYEVPRVVIKYNYN